MVRRLSAHQWPARRTTARHSLDNRDLGRDSAPCQRSHRGHPTVDGRRFGTSICFEDLFPEVVRQFAVQSVDFLVNMTNDAWFLKTGAPYQHAQASVLRAVEHRMPVVRSTNTGFSCFIDPAGRIRRWVVDPALSRMVEHLQKSCCGRRPRLHLCDARR